MVLETKTAEGLRIQIIPNCSATWRQTRAVIFPLAALCFAIAVFWAFQGAWVILPFAGLEVALLIFLTYRVCLETYHRQILYLSENRIELEWGKTYPKKVWHFDPTTAEFVITKPNHSLSAPHLVLEDKQLSVVVGDRLNPEDMNHLIDRIKDSGQKYRVAGATKTVALDVFE